MIRRWDFFTLYGLCFVIFLYTPVLLLPLFSFNDSIFAIFPLKGFTLNAYYQLADDAKLLGAVRNSVIVGICVAVLSTAFGLLAAMAVTRYRLPGKGPIVGAIMLPLVIPSIILGVALLVLVRQVFNIELSLWCVGAGHVLLCVPFSMLVLISRLEAEYKVAAGLEMAPFETARWISADDPADLKTFADLNRSAMAKDRDGNPVYMAKTSWDVGYVADRYPKVRFAATRER
jgi:ABC-type spermidine/putrescine transport system permease subunit II